MARQRLVTLDGNARNLLVMANENLVTNFKRRTTPSVAVPPLFERAFISHYEDAPLAFIIQFPDSDPR